MNRHTPIPGLVIKAFMPSKAGGYTFVPVYGVFRCPLTAELLAVTPHLSKEPKNQGELEFNVTHWRTGHGMPIHRDQRSSPQVVAVSAIQKLRELSNPQNARAVHNSRPTLNPVVTNIPQEWFIDVRAVERRHS